MKKTHFECGLGTKDKISVLYKHSYVCVDFITCGYHIVCSSALKWTHSPESLLVFSLGLRMHHGFLIFKLDNSFKVLQPSDRYDRTVWLLEGKLYSLLVMFTVY